MKKQFLILLSIISSILCFAQAPAISLVGENYLILHGERFKNQKIILNKADGDWYATAKDGHGTITFYGSYSGRELRLDMEWDGKKDDYPVTDENRHRQREAEFLITMADKAVYGDGLNTYPSGDDEVKIKLLKIDELSVSGNINGAITQGNEKINVSGAFNLKRNSAAKSIANSSYKNCDNIIHDKLIGAEGRSPSECEANYDLDVRTIIHDALVPIVEKFETDGWLVRQQTTLDPLTVVGRGSEKNIFSTGYDLELQASATSATYASYQKSFAEFTEKLRSPSKETTNAFMKFSHEMNSAIYSNIYFFVNNHGMGFSNYKGGTKVTKLSGKTYLIQSPYVSARTGGGEEASVDASFLLIGNWKQPIIEKLGGGSESIKASAILNPTASHLQAQNVIIRIECNAALAREIVDKLDLKKLEALLSN